MRGKFKDLPQYPIVYKGKTYNTTIRKELTDEEFKQCRDEYYTKPDFSLVKQQFHKLAAGYTKFNHITNYYFKDLMAKVRISSNNWCIEDAFIYKPLLEFFAGKCAASPHFYKAKYTLCENITKAFRLCGYGTCSKPAQFPIQPVDEILSKYNINGNYYDFACGWGVRLISSLRNNINYFGTDPNYLLHQRLTDLANDYRKETDNRCEVDIRVTGSEIFVSEWENKIGVAFSSPPYFDLEDYKIGNQSYKEGETTYQMWLDDYVKPTVENIYKYLILGGYFAVNIKDTDKYMIRKDWHEIITAMGFKFVDIHILKNHHRCHGHSEWSEDEDRLEKCGFNNNDEKIFVYQKIK